MVKILIPFIVIIFFLPSCVDKNKARRNLESTLIVYENSLLSKNFKEVIDFIPNEVFDGMIDQSHIKISREELKSQVVTITKEYYDGMKDLDFKFSEIGEMVQHEGYIFFRIRSEVSGKLYLEELEKTYDFWSKGFVLGISKDMGETFHFVNYENERSKTILDNVYNLVTPKLKLSYSTNNNEELISQMMEDYNQVAEHETRSKINTLYEKYKQAVFKLIIRDDSDRILGSGTGFVLGDYLITNNHVVDIEGAEYLEVFDYTGEKVAWDKFYDKDEYYDFAIFTLPEGNTVPTFPYYSISQHNVGEEVFTIGNPAGSASFTLTKGMVSGKINRGYQIDNDVFFGASGSPVFNEEGEVLGIVTAIDSSNTASFVLDIRNLPLNRMFPD